MIRSALLVLASLLTLIPLHARAQSVVGELMDGDAGRPVASGLVALTDLSGEVMDATITDETGRFQLSAHVPGDYVLVARAVGYAPAMDGVLELGEGGYIEVTFYLRPAPIQIPGITASVERTQRHLTAQGFYDRRDRGLGYFLGPRELEQRNPMDTRDVLRGVPGIQVHDNGFLGQSATCRGETPTVWIDGARVHFPNLPQTPGSDVDLDAVVGVHNIAAIEVYPRTAHVPIEYGGLSGSCVIVIWTRHY